MKAVYSKANQLLLGTKARMENNGELDQFFSTLKKKMKQLQAPFAFDYDIEAETRQLDLLIVDLDNELDSMKPKK